MQRRPLPLIDSLSLTLPALAISALAIWSAWDFGGGYLRTKFWATLGVTIAIACTLFFGCWRNQRRAISHPFLGWLAWIVALVGFLQAMPLSPSALQWISPGTHDAYSRWIPEPVLNEVQTSAAPSIMPIANAKGCLSVSPSDTLQALWIPLVFAASCFVSLRTVNGTGRWTLLLLLLPALAAGLFAFFGLADAIRLARETEVEMRQRLIISPVGADHPFGPFVNNNNAAGYLLLGLGCACGIFNALLGERHPRHVSASKESHLQGSLWKWIAIGLLIIVIMAGVLGSESRGGFLGMVVGFVGLLLFSPTTVSRRARFGMLGCVLLCSVLAWFFVSGIGIESRVSDRLNTLTEETIWNDPRIKHWQDAWIAAQAYFPAGSGFGTYRYAYLPYQQQGGPLWFVNADGMPVEWLVEGGLWLVPLVLLGIVWCIRALVRGNQSLRSSLTYDASQMAFITCATFTLPAFVVDQCFDYGVLHPPLLITLGMILGGLSAVQGTAGQDLEGQDLEGQHLSAQRSVDHPRWFARLGSVGLVVGLGYSALQLYPGVVCERYELALQDALKRDAEVRPDWDQALAQTESLLSWYPRDHRLHLTHAKLILARQIQRGADYLRQQNQGTPSERTRWMTVRNFRRALYMKHDGGPLMLSDILQPTQSVVEFQRAREHTIAALLCCPLDDAARVQLIDLDFLSEQAREGSGELFEQAAVLRQRNSGSLRLLESLGEYYPGKDQLPRLESYRRTLEKETQQARTQ